MPRKSDYLLLAAAIVALVAMVAIPVPPPERARAQSTATPNTRPTYDFESDVAYSFDPGDGQVLYLGVGFHTITPAIVPMYPLKAGTITEARWAFRNHGTLGTAETSTLVLRKNNTTDYPIATGIVLNGASRKVTGLTTGLAIPVAAGDYFEFKLTCPTWATNPTGMFFSGECDVRR